MKFKRCIFILMILVGVLVLPSEVEASDLKLTYNREWNECFYDTMVFPNYDDSGNLDGYFYVSNDRLVRQNLDDKIVYDDTLKSNINVDTLDSGLLINAIDESGNIVFSKEYNGNSYMYFDKAFNSYSNEGKHDGYIVFLDTGSTDLNVDPGYVIVKYDLKGNIVFEKNINSFSKMAGLYYLKNGSADFVYSHNGSYLMKIDPMSSNWQTVWQKDMSIDINGINYSYNKDGAIDGIIVAGGISANNTYLGIIAKYDLDGNEIFRSSYDVSSVRSVYVDVISSYLPDGSYDGYIVTSMSNDNKTFLVKYDLNGKKVFEKVYSSNDNIAFGLVDNFDKLGNQNGYLLYSTELGSGDKERKIETKEQVSTYEIDPGSSSCINLAIAKYTYDIFPVAKEENNGGTITVKSNAYPGELVKVKVVVKEGYSLQRIVVKDENGKEIEVNSDGTFIMPEGKVTVSAIYKRIGNPDTVSAAYMVLGVVFLIAVGSLIVIRQNNKKND